MHFFLSTVASLIEFETDMIEFLPNKSLSTCFISAISVGGMNNLNKSHDMDAVCPSVSVPFSFFCHWLLCTYN